MQNVQLKSTVGKCPRLPWMIEFHSTADGKILNKQLKAAFAANYLEHLSSLHEKSQTGRKRLTQLLGIVPNNPPMELLENLLKAGITVMQFKMTYFTPDQLREAVELLKGVTEHFGTKIGRVYPVAIGLDIADPEIVTGKVRKSQEIEFEKGAIIKITSKKEFEHQTSKDYIYVNYDNLSDVIKPGDSIILGDGQLNLSALNVAREIVNCIVERAGVLIDNLSVKLPNTPVTLPNIDNQIEFLKIGAGLSVDVAFVGPKLLTLAKEILGPHTTIILKIEYATAMDNFDKLLDEVDGVLLDGDKIITTSREAVFLIQKSVIARCNKKGIPVFSSINCNTVTKTQVMDISNTVIDGIDGLLLPPDCDLIETTSTICKASEAAIYQKQLFENMSSMDQPPVEAIYSLAIAAVEASFKCNAAAIILITTTGRSAKIISKYRPRCPIIALTRFGRIAKQLMLYKGVMPIFYVRSKEGEKFEHGLQNNMQLGMTFGKLNGFIRMGDAVVMVFGLRHGVGFRNCMEVVYASEYDTLPPDDDIGRPKGSMI